MFSQVSRKALQTSHLINTPVRHYTKIMKDGRTMQNVHLKANEFIERHFNKDAVPNGVLVLNHAKSNSYLPATNRLDTDQLNTPLAEEFSGDVFPNEIKHELIHAGQKGQLLGGLGNIKLSPEGYNAILSRHGLVGLLNEFQAHRMGGQTMQVSSKEEWQKTITNYVNAGYVDRIKEAQGIGKSSTSCEEFLNDIGFNKIILDWDTLKDEQQDNIRKNLPLNLIKLIQHSPITF